MIEITIECLNDKKSYISDELKDELNIEFEDNVKWRKGFVKPDDVCLFYEAANRENTLIELIGKDGFFRIKEDIETFKNKLKNY